jgi:hypothetical protein
MQIVPLQPVPSQTLSITLNNQACQINVYQKSNGLYFDLIVNGAPNPTVVGVLCLNGNPLVVYLYLGFIGDFLFIDTENLATPSDPDFTGLGGRFQLVYFTAADVAAAQAA